MNTPTKFFATTLVYSSCLVPIALADDRGYYPRFDGEVSVEVQNDYIFHSDDRDEEVNTLFTKTEPHFVLSFNDHLALEAGLVLEPVRDPDAGDDSWFYGEGLFAEELKLTYTTDDFGLYIGKFNPNFGTAFEQGPSIYGNDLAEDYELTERIGFGGFIPFHSGTFGEQTLSANVFFADTTFLSDSLITNRGRTSIHDGGISNTEDLSSFSISLDTEDLLGIEDLDTHIAYRHQSSGDADSGMDNENGFVLGFNYEAPLTENILGHALVEYAKIYNIDGGPDDADYATMMVDLNILENWTIAESYAIRNINTATGPNVRDYIYDLTAGYYFENGIGLNLSYTKAQESDIDRNGVGLLMTYAYEF